MEGELWKQRRALCLVIPALGAGGMERVLSVLAGEFCDRENLDVHLVMYGNRTDAFYDLPAAVQVHEPPFAYTDYPRFQYALRAAFYLRRKVEELEPAAILSFGEYWNSFVLLSLVGLPFRVVVSDRCSPEKSIGRIYDLLRKLLYKRAHAVVVQTEHAATIYGASFPDTRVEKIGNPVRSVSRGPFEEREKIVLSVGRLIATKHHDRLIRAFLRAAPADWKLVIAGDDSQKQQNRGRLRELARASRGENRVIFAGTTREVDDLYRRSSIFAFTSSSEGFPNAVAEALSAGLPVVAYNCVAGPSELVTDGENGFLVPVFDDESLERRLRELMHNEALRKAMGEKASEIGPSRSPRAVADEFLRVLLA